ncbi:hypothetical protein DWB85_16800 [Seongchinamella sediminis]|uniref:Uncharacterized protein n=1 Tax=Seongchinamella sediminis TaxID=2283635 RepID=A0A3L7DT68_9GAMM|nr:tetratricopeptide repeat protein [Seongchinamella sediminis]RLQ20564.1 hypothetical protein DWB85_16800 [Seongchinamella sediminis]
MKGFIAELRRRNVHRAAIAYLAVAWLLVQVLETTLPIYDLDESHIRWVVLALLIGFIPALCLAWVFEWSPGRLRAQADIDRDPEIAGGGSRKSDLVIIAVLAMAVLFFAIDKFLLSPASPWIGPPTKSIAVLPFDDMTAAQDQAYFADGLAEELLNLLAQNPALRVAARTSSFNFRHSGLAISDIASQLNVSHVLEGSVRRDGEQVRITVQLIEASSGFHVWSETYEEAYSDIFSIQDRISRQVSATLEAAILGDQLYRVRQADPHAYTLYLKGRYLARSGSPEKMMEATKLLRKALDIDSRYAPAWAELSGLYQNQAAEGLIDYDHGYRQGREAAQRAVSVDPDYAPGYDQLAWAAFWYDADVEAAIDYLQKGFQLQPQNLDLASGAATILQSLGRIDEAIKLHEYSVAASPLDAVATYNLALAYKYANRLDEAEQAFHSVLRLSPEYANVRYHLGEILLLTGRTEEALAIWATENDATHRVKGRALAYYSLGQQTQAATALDELIDQWGKKWPSEVAHVYAWRGELDEAFRWLELEYATYGAGGWGEWKLQPLYNNLRPDPRWQAFLARAGASDAQLARYQLEVPALDQEIVR